MRERPILFSAPMIRALLAGTKTVTRRIAHVPVYESKGPLRHPTRHPGPYFDSYCSEPKTTENPRGMSTRWCWWTADDRPDPLTEIRCPYGAPGDRLWVRETFCLRDPEHHPERGYWYAATDDVDEPKWTPSIFMRRAACRILLDVVSVRVERLNDITEDDAQREGVTPYRHAVGKVDHRTGFMLLWDEINGKRAAWSTNPWVWRVEFKLATAPTQPGVGE